MGTYSAGVTEIVTYPKCRAMRIFLSGGYLPEIKYMNERLEETAFEAGITRMEIGGRRGLVRAMPGYAELCTYMAKDLVKSRSQ